MPPRHTILVIDDEPDVVKSVQDLLRLEYRVLGTTRAEEGLQILERETVHVVMTDQRMPGMTGVEFLRHLRTEHPDAIRLLFTGYADIRAVIEAINEGNVYRYITKPWDPDELETVIREAVDRYDMIVERKRLMEELRDKNEELEKRNEELRVANELKSAFIHVASHELRTPLTILLGLAGLVRTVEGMPDPAPAWIARMQAAAERLQRLVDQIVTMLGIGTFDLPLERENTDIAALLTEAADDVRPFIDLRHQVMRCDFSADLGEITLDRMKVRDGLNHLLLNAVKFTRDGGVITLGARRLPDKALEISIADTGVGIDASSMPRLFEPFFTQFDVSHHSSGQYEHGRRGLGLGLSVVKAIVDKHGGTVAVQSKVGEGTTFTIVLPAGEEAAE